MLNNSYDLNEIRNSIYLEGKNSTISTKIIISKINDSKNPKTNNSNKNRPEKK